MPDAPKVAAKVITEIAAKAIVMIAVMVTALAAPVAIPDTK